MEPNLNPADFLRALGSLGGGMPDPPDWDWSVEAIQQRMTDHPKLKNLVPGMVLVQKLVGKEPAYRWPKIDEPCVFVRYVQPGEITLDCGKHFSIGGNMAPERDIVVAVAVDKENGDLICFYSDSSNFTVYLEE